MAKLRKLERTHLSMTTSSSSRWLGNAGEDVADENRFHNV